MGMLDWFKRGVSEMAVARPDDAKSPGRLEAPRPDDSDEIEAHGRFRRTRSVLP